MEIGAVAWLVGVCVVWVSTGVFVFFWSRLLRLPQRVGVSRSTLPASLFEHLSTGQEFHRHQRTKVRALMPNVARSPPPVSHCQRTGLSSQARTCSRKWSFLLAPPHLFAPVPRLDCSSQEVDKQKLRQHVCGQLSAV